MRECPFCHCTDLHLIMIDIRQKEGQLVAMGCDECGTQGPTAYCQSTDEAAMERVAQHEWDYNPNVRCIHEVCLNKETGIYYCNEISDPDLSRFRYCILEMVDQPKCRCYEPV